MLAIPIRLLWKVQIKLRQKLGFGIFLCLSVFMMITAIVRISSLRVDTTLLGVPINAIDVPWKLFWQQAEACIAVLMVSLTAIRSIFMGEPSNSPPAKPFYSSSRRWIWNRNNHDALDESTNGTNGLPMIPSATITGLRTFIHAGREEGQEASGAEGGTKTTTITSEVYEPSLASANKPAPGYQGRLDV